MDIAPRAQATKVKIDKLDYWTTPKFKPLGHQKFNLQNGIKYLKSYRGLILEYIKKNSYSSTTTKNK